MALNELLKSITIVATEKRNGERTEIKDLYWFEENYVHSFDDDRFDFDVIFDQGPVLTAIDVIRVLAAAPEAAGPTVTIANRLPHETDRHVQSGGGGCGGISDTFDVGGVGGCGGLGPFPTQEK